LQGLLKVPVPQRQLDISLARQFFYSRNSACQTLRLISLPQSWLTKLVIILFLSF
jgi:hypothetical protein